MALGQQSQVNSTTCPSCKRTVHIASIKASGDERLCIDCIKKTVEAKRIRASLAKFNEIVPPRYKEFMDQPLDNDLCGKDGCYIFGCVGSGKTCLALQIARRAVQEGKGDVIRHSVPSLMGILKDFKNRNMLDEVQKFKDVPILILDDLGAEKQSEYAYEMLYGILNYRSEWCKYTVITSNISFKELEGRIASRIVQMCVIKELNGQDRRLK